MSYKYKPPSGYRAVVTRREIVTEFERWNAQADERVVTDYDLPLAKIGTIAADVRFVLRGQPVLMHIDEWGDHNTNLRCVLLNIRDMRLTEVRGGATGMREAYVQLAPPARERDPWEVLGLRPGASRDEIDAMYKARAKRAHPDAGGSDAAMTDLNRAYEALREMVS